MTYTVDEIVALAAQHNITPPAWGKSWNRLKDYNGFTHEQRVRGWQAMHLAITMEIIAPASVYVCDICGARHPKRLQYHSEDYCKLAEHVLCVSCHKTLHQRFRNPEPWCKLVAKYAKDNEWYKTLSLTRPA